jgi:hypothetical protein
MTRCLGKQESGEEWLLAMKIKIAISNEKGDRTDEKLTKMARTEKENKQTEKPNIRGEGPSTEKSIHAVQFSLLELYFHKQTKYPSEREKTKSNSIKPWGNKTKASKLD